MVADVCVGTNTQIEKMIGRMVVALDLKHKHHILPKKYLRGFAADETSRQIWVYTKGRDYMPGMRNGCNPQLLSITLASVVFDNYASTDHEGKKISTALRTPSRRLSTGTIVYLIRLEHYSRLLKRLKQISQVTFS
jgi:hypothetical protein